MEDLLTELARIHQHHNDWTNFQFLLTMSEIPECPDTIARPDLVNTWECLQACRALVVALQPPEGPQDV